MSIRVGYCFARVLLFLVSRVINILLFIAELNELNRFISMLPNTGEGAYSIESTVISLYRSCREIDSLDKSQSDLLLKRAINAVGEFC